MADPCLTIDVDKIERNARVITGLCARHGIEVTGVTKGVCGQPEVARAMLRGGVGSIGESRLANLARLRAGGVDSRCMLLRIPALSQVDEVVAAVDLSLNSELAAIAALSAAARRRGRVHDVIVMVDLGDLREGVWIDDLPAFLQASRQLDGVRVVGLGTSLSCFGGVVPSAANMRRLVEQAEQAEGALGRPLALLSGGASSALPLVAGGRMPARVNHLRIGEGILLGRETIHRQPLAHTCQDAFVLSAEVLEVKRKPSLPVGERGEDAFGRRPAFVDRGDIDRAILNVGRADVDVAAVRPLDPRLAVLGGSSDYLLVDVTAAAGSIRVGDALSFSLGYGALLAAMGSAYVEKRILGPGAAGRAP